MHKKVKNVPLFFREFGIAVPSISGLLVTSLMFSNFDATDSILAGCATIMCATFILEEIYKLRVTKSTRNILSYHKFWASTGKKLYNIYKTCCKDDLNNSEQVTSNNRSTKRSSNAIRDMNTKCSYEISNTTVKLDDIESEKMIDKDDSKTDVFK